jgi:hypothetical protein
MAQLVRLGPGLENRGPLSYRVGVMRRPGRPELTPELMS